MLANAPKLPSLCSGKMCSAPPPGQVPMGIGDLHGDVFWPSLKMINNTKICTIYYFLLIASINNRLHPFTNYFCNFKGIIILTNTDRVKEIEAQRKCAGIKSWYFAFHKLGKKSGICT